MLKTLCVTLALALALPAGAFALGQDVDINETNFPDQIFRGWLLDKGNLNGMGADGVLTSGELAQITVLDLTGISHFTALERLNVNNNRLTSLDVSKNTRLTSLYCATNALEHLDVTGCPEQVDLNCERNRLTELNLAGNPKLVQLYCRHNSLTQLDVSRNLELVFIETFDNSLTSFDCSMLKKLEFLHIDYYKLTTLWSCPTSLTSQWTRRCSTSRTPAPATTPWSGIWTPPSPARCARRTSCPPTARPSMPGGCPTPTPCITGPTAARAAWSPSPPSTAHPLP